MTNEELFQKLKKTHTLEEIADNYIILADVTPEEKEKLHAEMREIRLQQLKDMTEEDFIFSDVARLWTQIRKYVKEEKFSFEKTFGKFLAEYIRATRRTRKEMAEELAIHYTKLSRIINDKEEPNIALAYRLEKHSDNIIKAELWWKLMVKKQEFIITKDEETKKIEQDKVKNILKKRA